MDFTKAEINEAANLLRHQVDSIWSQALDAGSSADYANKIANPLYDAITTLHEAAMKGARK